MADRCEEMLLKAGNLSQEEVAKVLKFIDDLKDDPRQAQKVIMESRALRDRAALAERQAPLAAATRLKFTTGILRATGKAIESGKKRIGRTAKSLVDAARSYYVSTNKDITGARNSVDAKAAFTGLNGFSGSTKNAGCKLQPRCRGQGSLPFGERRTVP